MLLREDRRRREHRDLLAVLHGLECRAQRDLRLAVADISADQAVHDLRALHVPLRVFNRLQLVLRLLVREHFLEFPLPLGVRAVDEAVLLSARRVERDKLLRDSLHGRLHAASRLLPLLSAELVQLRLRGLGARVFLQLVELRRKDVEIAPAVLDLDVVAERAVHFYLLDAPVNAESVVLVYDIVADRQIGEARNFLSAVLLALSALLPVLSAENIRVRDHREADLRVLKAARRVPVHDGDLPGLQRLRVRFHREKYRRQVHVRKSLRKAPCP